MTDYSVPPSRITGSHLHSICGYHVHQLMELELEPELKLEPELVLEQYSTAVTKYKYNSNKVKKLNKEKHSC